MISGQWADFSFWTGTGQPHPPQSPAALQVSWGKPKARVLTWHLSMGLWIFSMKSPSRMHDPRGFESTYPGPSRFSTVVNSLERDGLPQALLPWIHRMKKTTTDYTIPVCFRSTLGKYRHQKQPWVTPNIFHLCNKRRELKKDRRSKAV